MTPTENPIYRLLWPTIRAIKDLGGSATRQEVLAKVASGFAQREQAEMMPNGRTSRIHYYTGWTLTALKRVGVLENSRQGVWALTDRGRSLTEEDTDALWQEVRTAYRPLRDERRRAEVEVDGGLTDGEQLDAGDESEADAWKDELLQLVKALTPSGFERFCQRLLREAGVEQVQVLGGGGDQGIDGVGIMLVGLLSFRLYFQAKRYERSVAPSVVRDFRGAMAGRGEKGLIVTTATFTDAAYREATRDGVPLIDLIDGDRLCELMKRYGLGVQVPEKTVEDVEVDSAFWERFE